MYLEERECYDVQLITLRLRQSIQDMGFLAAFPYSHISQSAKNVTLRIFSTAASQERLVCRNQGNLKTALFCFRKVNEPSMESRGVKGFRQTHYKLQHTLGEWNCDLEPHIAPCPWGTGITDKVQRQDIQLNAINEWYHGLSCTVTVILFLLSGILKETDYKLGL